MKLIEIDMSEVPHITEVTIKLLKDNTFIIKEVIGNEITLDPSEYKLIPNE